MSEPQGELFCWFCDFCDLVFSHWIFNVTSKWETFFPQTDFLWRDTESGTEQASVCFYHFRKFLHRLPFFLFQYLICFKYYSPLWIRLFAVLNFLSLLVLPVISNNQGRNAPLTFLKLVRKLVRSAESFRPWPQMELPTFKKRSRMSRMCNFLTHWWCSRHSEELRRGRITFNLQRSWVFKLEGWT